MQKLKYIALGIIIGATVIATPSIASEIKEYMLYKADYKIIVNGQPYSNDELPILNYKGVTYTPLKAIGTLLNSDVQWNAEVGQVEIVKKEAIISPISKDENTVIENDTRYFTIRNIEDAYACRLKYEKGILSLYKNISYETKTDLPVLSNIGYKVIQNKIYISEIILNNEIIPMLKIN